MKPVSRRRYEPAAETIPNLAPMVDVIMVLLVFFLLGASLNLLPEGILHTELDPSSGPGAGVAIDIHPLIRIGLLDTDDGASAAIFVLDEPLPEGDFEFLYEYLRQRIEAGADPDNAIVIGAEEKVRWKFVVKAMDAAVRAGFKNVQFAVSFASRM